MPNANFHFIKTISSQNFLNRFLTFKANYESKDTSPFYFQKFTMNKVFRKVSFRTLNKLMNKSNPKRPTADPAWIPIIE